MRFKLISCEVLARQVYYVAALSPNVVDIELIDKGLHSEPEVLRDHLQARIDAIPGERYDALLMGYGLCSNAVMGLISPELPMVIPRAHDCITLYLGSTETYGTEFRETPGTYWYTADYMERGGSSSDTISLGSTTDEQDMDRIYQEYVAKYGQDNADYLMEVMGAWSKHYSRAAYIDTDEMSLPDYRVAVKELAAKRGWRFQELAGSLILLRDLIDGNWNDERFLVVAPGQTVMPTHDERIVAACRLSDALS